MSLRLILPKLPDFVVQGLATSALDRLFAQLQDDDEDFRRCCPFCCAPCRSLRELFLAGALRDAVLPHDRVPGCEWWSAADGTVSVEFLDQAWGWRMACCDETLPRATPYERAPMNWVDPRPDVESAL